MSKETLKHLRDELEAINMELLALLNRRATVVTQVQQIKEREGMPTHQPQREQEMLEALVKHNCGPFSNDVIVALFREIFRASCEHTERQRKQVLQISRENRQEDLVLEVKGRQIGKQPIWIAGPCAVESEEQMDAVGRELSQLDIPFMRGGAFKPRSSPYAFQGLKEEGLRILRDTAVRYGLISVSEVMDPRKVELACEYVDILQIGSRNMYNYDLLREVGRTHKPILLKRGLSATLEEFLWAAEYIALEGNQQVILCERGIRTFEQQTRNTFDVSAIPLLKQQSYLPVIADVSHAAGRKDLLIPLGRSALAAGADGLMVEVHPCPSVARSDSQQQLDFAEFRRFYSATSAICTISQGEHT